MARKNKPAAKAVPDPSRSYERSRPEDEAGMGRLDCDPTIPDEKPDRIHKAVTNRQAPRQINTDAASTHEHSAISQESQDQEQSSPIKARHKTHAPKVK